MLNILLLGAAVAAAQPVRNPDMFTNLEIGEVVSLDPAYPYDGASQSAIQNVYETLIAFKGASLSEYEPRIASQVPTLANKLVSPDGRTFRFPIRKGVRFHDGSEVTPEDVRYSLLRFMITDRSGGPSALLLEPIAGAPSTRNSSGAITLDFAALSQAVRIEGRDVVVTLPRPFGPFLSIMARWSYIVPKAWCLAHGEWDGTEGTWKSFNDPPQDRSYLHQNANGAGPFKLERWDRTARYVLLERHEAYFRGPARLKRVLIKSVPEFNTRKLMLQAGDADLIETPRPYASQLAGIDGVVLLDGLRRLQTDPALFFTFKINPVANPDIGSGRLDGEGIPPDFFSDDDVRKGFSYAFDYDAILRDTFKGAAVRALGPIPPSVPGHDPSQPRYAYDLKKAEEHLRKARGGLVWSKGFRFTLTYNTGAENREAAAQILRKNLESLNPRFRVDLRGVDWASFLDKAQRQLMPLFARGWLADYPDAHNFVYAFYHSAGRYPSAQGYTNAELDALIEMAAAQPAPSVRASLYKKILAKGYDQASAIFTVHPAGVYGMRTWVRGLVDNPVNLGLYYYPIDKK
ncbi:MAG: ABC transporter substrate-binding protein [Elusimicrobiota bacterium]